MLVGSKAKLSKVRNVGLSLNNEIIDSVNEFKYLSMYLDNQLHFHNHIDRLVNKTTDRLGLLYKTRWLFDESTALSLYKALISPPIDFGSTIYEVAPEYQLRRLQLVQSVAALVEQPGLSTYAMHEKLKLDTLATRQSKAMVRITYGCIHDKEPALLFNCLKPVEHRDRVTRATEAGYLQVPRTQTNYGKMGYSFQGPMQWNLTRTDLKAAVNKPQLKSLIKTSWGAL